MSETPDSPPPDWEIDVAFHRLLAPAAGGLPAATKHLQEKVASGLIPVHFGINFVVWGPKDSASAQAGAAATFRPLVEGIERLLVQVQELLTRLQSQPKLTAELLDELRGVRRPEFAPQPDPAPQTAPEQETR